MSYSAEEVKAALKGVQDPDLKRDLVELGMIGEVTCEGKSIELTVELTTPACPLKDKIGDDITAALKERLGAEAVSINWTANTQSQGPDASELIPGVKNIVLIASGKGGVGKSTISANVATVLAAHGAAVGLLDADVYGPSIPTMFDIHNQPQATEDQRILPHVKFGLKIMSMGFLLEAGQPVIWRGPMLDSAMQQFLGQVDWGELDYLIIDLPPGTGDVQLSLSRMTPGAEAVVVTTPQDVALADVERAIGMFKTVGLSTLGVVENMSGFICGHCGERTDIFGRGAGKKAAEKYGLTDLGSVPLTEKVVHSGDAGRPITVSDPDDPAAVALSAVAGAIAQRLAIRASEKEPAEAGRSS